MPEVASGLLQQPDAVKAMILACPSWQTWVGADYANHVHVAGADNEVIVRPFIDINIDEFTVDSFTGHARGTVRIWIEEDVTFTYGNELFFANADIWFRNRIGPLLSEMIALSRVGSGHLAINGQVQIQGPWRNDGTQEPGEGDYYAAELTIPFGV